MDLATQIGKSPADEDGPHVDEIRSQLARIVGSAVFNGSLRLTEFLNFVVETTLAGKANSIKAYTIAVEALGRRSDFDPQTDPIVRVEAGRLRTALARYYSEAGRDDPVGIELPRGTYVPILRWRREPAKALQSAAERKPGPDRLRENSGRGRQLGASLTTFGQLAKAHRQQMREVAAEIASARQALATARALLEAADNYICAHLPAAPPEPASEAQKAADARGEASLSSDAQAEPAAYRMLDELNRQLHSCHGIGTAAEAILDATIRLHEADFGNVQLFDEATGELIISAQRGFSEEWLEPFKRLSPQTHGYACGRAIRARAPVVIKDVFGDAEYAALRRFAAEAGYRALQSTPLIASDGRLVGVVSTHFARPRTPSRFEMLMTQLYARLAADVIERLLAPPRDKAADPADRAGSAHYVDFAAALPHRMVAAGRAGKH